MEQHERRLHAPRRRDHRDQEQVAAASVQGDPARRPSRSGLEATFHSEPRFQVQQEIFDVEKTLELLNKAIEDKLQPIKVAHTRLQARTNRPHLEKCRDQAQDR